MKLWVAFWERARWMFPRVIFWMLNLLVMGLSYRGLGPRVRVEAETEK